MSFNDVADSHLIEDPLRRNVGFPTTQEVNEQNAMAEQMVAEKAAKIKRDAECVSPVLEAVLAN